MKNPLQKIDIKGPNTHSVQKVEKLSLILPSLSAGGMERVMSLFANYCEEKGLKVHMILLSKKKRFYRLNPSIVLEEPEFTIEKYPRIVFQLKVFYYLHKILKNKPKELVLSFGGKYNAFVLLAAIGTKVKVFISDRSKPSISYGRSLDLLNRHVYRLSAGIIAQTNDAKILQERQTGHPNIKVIPNPIRKIGSNLSNNLKRKKVVLNIGRFITTKHQDWLVTYFDAVAPLDWELIFLGSGQNEEEVKDLAISLNRSKSIHFFGEKENISPYYLSSSIFAFTSTSEGFPNALGEAMSAGCACISFDCEAGPSELIDDGVDGFLVPEGDHEIYKAKLKLLMENEQLRLKFGREASEKMKAYRIGNIAEQYLEFMASTL